MKLREILEAHKEFYDSREEKSVPASELYETYERFLEGEAEIDEDNFLCITMIGLLKRTFFKVS